MVRMIARSINVRLEKDFREKAELHLSVRQWQRVPWASVFSYILLGVHSSASKNPQSRTIIFWPPLENLKKMFVIPPITVLVHPTLEMSCRTQGRLWTPPRLHSMELDTDPWLHNNDIGFLQNLENMQKCHSRLNFTFSSVLWYKNGNNNDKDRVQCLHCL